LKIRVERTVHNRYRNLLVAATGTGKTVISAFDYKTLENNKSSELLLWLIERNFTTSKATFQGVLKDNNFGIYGLMEWNQIQMNMFCFGSNFIE
jgi:superfamily II DNA or RNA helicase